MTQKNIFVIGLNEFNLGELETIDRAEEYNFIRIFHKKELQEKFEEPALHHFIERAKEKIDGFEGKIDGIIGFFDFPVTLLTFLLGKEYQTIVPSLISGFKCEHKYWSRVEQQKVIPDHIPDFTAIDPFDPPDFDEIELNNPFWLKPVKSFASQLGFKINTRKEYENSLQETREGIQIFADPFNYLLSYIDLPDEIAHVDGNYCIAEELIGGRQCTLSGYVYKGEVYTYGIVDSINYQEAPSFFYYFLPSNLPGSVQQRMEEITDTVMKQIGFDNYPFNIEFFYDMKNDRIKLLEINPRMSQSHSDLYAKVKGSSNHEVLVKIITGQFPDFANKMGEYKCAGKFHYRVFREDGVVTRIPSKEDIKKIQQEFPGTIIYVEAKKNKKLSDLPIQDSYSYRLANIYAGEDNKEALLKKYRKIINRLNIEIK